MSASDSTTNTTPPTSATASEFANRLVSVSVECTTRRIAQQSDSIPQQEAEEQSKPPDDKDTERSPVTFTVCHRKFLGDRPVHLRVKQDLQISVSKRRAECPKSEEDGESLGQESFRTSSSGSPEKMASEDKRSATEFTVRVVRLEQSAMDDEDATDIGTMEEPRDLVTEAHSASGPSTLRYINEKVLCTDQEMLFTNTDPVQLVQAQQPGMPISETLVHADTSVCLEDIEEQSQSKDEDGEALGLSDSRENMEELFTYQTASALYNEAKDNEVTSAEEQATATLSDSSEDIWAAPRSSRLSALLEQADVEDTIITSACVVEELKKEDLVMDTDSTARPSIFVDAGETPIKKAYSKPLDKKKHLATPVESPTSYVEQRSPGCFITTDLADLKDTFYNIIDRFFKGLTTKQRWDIREGVCNMDVRAQLNNMILEILLVIMETVMFHLSQPIHQSSPRIKRKISKVTFKTDTNGEKLLSERLRETFDMSDSSIQESLRSSFGEALTDVIDSDTSIKVSPTFKEDLTERVSDKVKSILSKKIQDSVDEIYNFHASSCCQSSKFRGCRYTLRRIVQKMKNWIKNLCARRKKSDTEKAEKSRWSCFTAWRKNRVHPMA